MMMMSVVDVDGGASGVGDSRDGGEGDDGDAFGFSMLVQAASADPRPTLRAVLGLHESMAGRGDGDRAADAGGDSPGGSPQDGGPSANVGASEGTAAGGAHGAVPAPQRVTATRGTALLNEYEGNAGILATGFPALFPCGLGTLATKDTLTPGWRRYLVRFHDLRYSRCAPCCSSCTTKPPGTPSTPAWGSA